MKFLAALVIGMFCFGLGYFVARSTPESEPTVSEPNQDIAVENFIQTIQQKAQTQPEDRPAWRGVLRGGADSRPRREGHLARRRSRGP